MRRFTELSGHELYLVKQAIAQASCESEFIKIIGSLGNEKLQALYAEIVYEVQVRMQCL